jgi:uncharacterized membrane protein
MSNTNRNVIIAYFPSVEQADAAEQALRDWDKADDDIKLGGIGILHVEEGEVKIRNVGARDTATGAKAGAIIGIITGILSGGMTLIGGALAGLAAGAMLGSLKHQGLGLTDGDIAEMKAELTSGKAALIVTADDNEVNDTKQEIERLGGNVVSYTADREALETLALAAAEEERRNQISTMNTAGWSGSLPRS